MKLRFDLLGRKSNRDAAAEKFSPQNIERWKQGAKRYKDFSRSSEVRGMFIPLETERGLQTVFLGEKPALFVSLHQAGFDATLLRLGLKIAGEFVYDPAQVQDVINKHSEIFNDYGETNADKLMERLSKEPKESAHNIRGLVLGFPLASTLDFERVKRYRPRVESVIDSLCKILTPRDREFVERNFNSEKVEGNIDLRNFIIAEIKLNQKALNLTTEDISELTVQITEITSVKRINVHGNKWMDYKDDPESNDKQRRIKAAFKNSGLLNLLG